MMTTAIKTVKNQRAKLNRAAKRTRGRSGLISSVSILDDPKKKARILGALHKWEDKCRPLLDDSRSSEQLSERDLEVRINTRD